MGDSREFARRANANKDPPFAPAGAFTLPCEGYLAHVDRILRRTTENGILVLLTPTHLGYPGGNQGCCAKMKDGGFPILGVVPVPLEELAWWELEPARCAFVLMSEATGRNRMIAAISEGSGLAVIFTPTAREFELGKTKFDAVDLRVRRIDPSPPEHLSTEAPPAPTVRFIVLRTPDRRADADIRRLVLDVASGPRP